VAERLALSTKPVAQKLSLKSGSRALVLKAPVGYLALLPKDVQMEQEILGDAAYDFIQVFATRREEVLSLAPKLRQALKLGGLLWVSYPKGKTVPTDLNRDILRVTLQGVGLEAVSQVAIDGTWSALRAKVL
jgi:hypothetical protein